MIEQIISEQLPETVFVELTRAEANTISVLLLHHLSQAEPEVRDLLSSSRGQRSLANVSSVLLREFLDELAMDPVTGKFELQLDTVGLAVPVIHLATDHLIQAAFSPIACRRLAEQARHLARRLVTPLPVTEETKTMMVAGPSYWESFGEGKTGLYQEASHA